MPQYWWVTLEARTRASHCGDQMEAKLSLSCFARCAALALQAGMPAGMPSRAHLPPCLPADLPHLELRDL